MTDKDIERFLNKVTPEPNTGCWLWEGFLSSRKAPVGSFGYKNKSIYAHRFSYLAFIGKIPKNFCVCHKCDTPACVNPSHLFVGTQKDNIRDRHLKKRSAGPKGSANGNSRFNDALIALILKERKSFSYMELAKRHNCSKSAIAHICKRRSWKHVSIIKEDKQDIVALL